MTGDSSPSVCIIVENESVPFDRRVWQEARALRDSGYRVSIICPKTSRSQVGRETLEGVEIYRHRKLEAPGRAGYLLEYGFALAAEFFLAAKVFWRSGFQVLLGCNPPDTIFLIALAFRPLGVKFVFDHHDLSPELYEAKFIRRGLLYRALCLTERMCFRAADLSIATNDSYREIAIGRGKMKPDHVVVVQTCADLDEVVRSNAMPVLKRGRKYMVLYVGVMNEQDGVRLLIESIECLVKRRSRDDTHFVLIGDGTELSPLKALADQLGLGDFVEFTGRIPHDQVLPYLSTADVCVSPDPLNPLNDKSTMIKILEYMAFGRPIVLYNLTEGRLTVGDGALYAKPDDPIDFAKQIDTLLESEPLRTKLGDSVRKRAKEELNWGVQKGKLVDAFSMLFNEHSKSRVTSALGPRTR